MNENLQEIVALAFVALVVVIGLVRRYGKGRSAKPGCAGCESGTGQNSADTGEAPIKFYKKSGQG